ncbi:MAG: VacJ family lipoprotein [Pseudohongiellaceae bacterium]
MKLRKIACNSLLAGFLIANSVTQVLAQDSQDNPLSGTGITPNVVGYTEYPDPLIRFNRAMFGFNDVAYRYVIIPAANAYMVLPEPVRDGVGNFFDNIKTPIPLVNQLLQLKGRDAGVSFLRFLVNSTVGIVGIFDPATTWLQLERSDTGFNETLAHYGVDYGPYLVMPFAGPATIREGSGLIADGFLNPLAYVLDSPKSIAVRAADNLQEFAPFAEGYLSLCSESQDLYIFMRELHLQSIQRDAQFE